jgi:DmsE family decaheme c-type cytochrome
MMGKLMCILAAVAALYLMMARAPAQEAQAPVPVGNDECTTCHVRYAGHKQYAYHSDCLSCHTAQDSHLVDGGRGSATFPANDDCLICHRDNNPKLVNWRFSDHSKAQLACRNCHGIHSDKIESQPARLFKADSTSIVCMTCHQDTAARLNMPSHHPVVEGALSCVSCHDPHAGRQTSLLGNNEQCTRCHQNVRGPRVFEHAPVVEDCGICHNPHGSPNRRLLQLAQPMQCLQCHSLSVNRHAGQSGGSVRLTGAQMRSCTHCHGAVHGSHSDPLLTR